MLDIASLIVPVNLRAALITQPVLNQGSFGGAVNNYDQLLNYMKSPAPEPFVKVQTSGVKQGINLHWSLPSALTHGDRKSLFSVTDGIQDIVSSLQRNIASQPLIKAFSDNSYPLSADTIVSNDSTNNWLLQDYQNSRKYLISYDDKNLIVKDAKVTFPIVPNRWVILRFQHGTTKIDPIGWIIESDYLNAQNGTSPYLDPLADEMQAKTVTKIGRSILLTAGWQDTEKDKNIFLQAIGPGDVSFAAYAPGVENVFSFIDTMKLNPSDQSDSAPIIPDNTALSYMVFGWYSNNKYDPLFGVNKGNIATYLKDLAWAIPNQDTILKDIESGSRMAPSLSYYHGIIYSVKWQTKLVPTGEDTEIPQNISDNVNVAIGSTAVEALAAILQNKVGADAVDTTLLEAFQYGVVESLDEPGGEVLLNDKIRQARYGSSNGGTLWDIVPASSSDNSTPEDIDLSKYDLALANLNTQQRILDEQMRSLRSLQSTLYCYWWKNKNINTTLTKGPANQPEDWDSITSDLDPNSNRYKGLVSTITDLRKKIAVTATTIPGIRDNVAINEYSKKVLSLPATLQLKATNIARFWSLSDPVVLVSGLGNVLPHDSDKLTCRLSSQLVSGLEIKGKVVKGSEVTQFIPVSPKNTDVPEVLQELSVELYFLDPNNALTLSRDAFKGAVSAQEVLEALKSPSYGDKNCYGPDILSFVLWKQAWKPLYLEWSINWYSTCTKDSNGNWTFDRTNWTFDGDDYQWIGGNPTSNAVQYQGKSILSPHSVINFEKRLQDYITKYPKTNEELVHLDGMLKEIKAWGVLSQRLSGFHEKMLTRNIEQNFAPSKETAALIDDQYHFTPFPDLSDQDSFGPPSPYFFPQLGGFFGIESLSILDSFGQRINLLAANNNKSSSAAGFIPIRSKQLQPSSGVSVHDFSQSQLMHQPFGLLQPARLDMRWVDANDNTKECGLSTGANPVCGWILPNHLDNGLSIYGPAGELFGELYVGEKGTPARWVAAPDSQTPISDPTKIPNLYLRNMVNHLLIADQADKSSITNFMNVIDETLWTVDPLGERGDQNLSVLIGRPLVVVRLKLQLTLEGDLYYNQGWGDTFKQNDGNIKNLPYNIRLGSVAIRQDGLLGYYADDQCSVFNSVHYPEGIIQASPPYVKLIGKDNNYLSLNPCGNAIYLTLVFDPRGTIHASTGFLPVKEITLPHRFTNQAMKKMELVFQVESLFTDSSQILIPRLTEQHGDWSWINHTSITDYTTEQVNYIDGLAKLSSNQFIIRDGWLRLLTKIDNEK